MNRLNRVLLLSLILLLTTATLAQAQRMPITTTSDAARAHYVQGEHATGNVDFERARAHFSAALTADPDFAMAHLYSAVLAGGDERAEHMRHAKANAAQASEAERQMIEAYAANLEGEHDREGELFTDLAERFPSDPMPMFWWANTEANRGNSAEAVAAANRALAADPSFAPAYNLIGYAEMAAGNEAAAEQAFREQIRLAPEEANPYDSFGEFYLNHGKLDEAAAQYEMALTKNPAFANARTMLARIGIEAVTADYTAAVQAGNPAAISALHADDAILHPPNEPSVSGREAIDAYFERIHSEPADITYTTEEVAVSESGDMAYEVGTWEGGKYLTVYRRTPDGWKIVADSWSDDAPSTATN